MVCAFAPRHDAQQRRGRSDAQGRARRPEAGRAGQHLPIRPHQREHVPRCLQQALQAFDWRHRHRPRPRPRRHIHPWRGHRAGPLGPDRPGSGLPLSRRRRLTVKKARPSRRPDIDPADLRLGRPGVAQRLGEVAVGENLVARHRMDGGADQHPRVAVEGEQGERAAAIRLLPGDAGEGGMQPRLIGADLGIGQAGDGVVGALDAEVVAIQHAAEVFRRDIRRAQHLPFGVAPGRFQPCQATPTISSSGSATVPASSSSRLRPAGPVTGAPDDWATVACPGGRSGPGAAILDPPRQPRRDWARLRDGPSSAWNGFRSRACVPWRSVPFRQRPGSEPAEQLRLLGREFLVGQDAAGAQVGQLLDLGQHVALVGAPWYCCGKV